jgi:predicted phosphodiesterase
VKKILFIPDTHAPFQDERAVRVVEHVVNDWQPEIIVVLGDWLDNLAVSGHEPTKVLERNLKREVRAAATRLEGLTRGVEQRHFVMGNHETRLERFIAKKAPELAGMLEVEDMLELHKWTSVTQYNETLRLGKLNITHDVGKAGQNAHRSAAQSYMGSTIIGHTHRMGYDVIGRQAGPPVVAAMFGWLGDYRAVEYLHRAEAKRWPLGFGVGRMEASGVVHVTPVPIVNYKACVEGVLYGG